MEKQEIINNVINIMVYCIILDTIYTILLNRLYGHMEPKIKCAIMVVKCFCVCLCPIHISCFVTPFVPSYLLYSAFSFRSVLCFTSLFISSLNSMMMTPSCLNCWSGGDSQSSTPARLSSTSSSSSTSDILHPPAPAALFIYFSLTFCLTFLVAVFFLFF